MYINIIVNLPLSYLDEVIKLRVTCFTGHIRIYVAIVAP